MNKRSSKSTTGQTKEDPRAAAVLSILNIAQLVRQKGTPDEADEALEWEKKLQNRLQEIEQAQAA